MAILAGILGTVLIAFAGLAVDSGRAYGVSARLNAAVDAAAIAAARALVNGATDAERAANAQSAGVRYFNLNYPAGYMGSTPSVPTVNAVKQPNGRWTVAVNATATMPVTFLNVLGAQPATVSASGQTVRRDLDVVLVLDSSGSIGSAMPLLRSAANNGFVSKFAAGPGGDRVGLVTFASGATVPPNTYINTNSTRGFNRTAVTNAINALNSTGVTASADAFRLALEQLEAVPVAVRSSLRVILFFSDGAPNNVTGTFTRSGGGTVTGNLFSNTGTLSATTRATQISRLNNVNSFLGDYPDIVNLPSLSFGPNGLADVPLVAYHGRRTLSGGSPIPNSQCNVNRAARSTLENLANRARGQDIIVYTIGLGPILNSIEVGGCGYTTANEAGSVILRRLANVSGVDTFDPAQKEGRYCFAANASELDACFNSIASEILRLAL